MSDEEIIIPTETLPSVTPTLTGLSYIDIVGDKFTYGLTADNYAFGYWAEKVEDPYYIVNPIDTLNSERFSSFIISHDCITEEQGDGCCMIHPELGGVCLIREASATAMATYRFSA